MYTFTTVLLACICFVAGGKPRSVVVGIDQKVVCNVKRSCVDCLRLTHCSWCKTNNRCFSNVTPFFCEDDPNECTDFGFSLEENARCSCGEDSGLGVGCRPLEAKTAEPPCSGRGRCLCQRCVCDTYENSTKMLMGDYCEYDNFSCDGPGCNEGPYSLRQPQPDTDAPWTWTWPLGGSA